MHVGPITTALSVVRSSVGLQQSGLITPKFHYFYLTRNLLKTRFSNRILTFYAHLHRARCPTFLLITYVRWSMVSEIRTLFLEGDSNALENEL